MARRRLQGLLGICMLVALIGVSGATAGRSARAQVELRVVDTAVEASFPGQLSFSIEATSGASITDIRLHYRVVRHSFATIISEAFLSFEPGTSVRASWQWDMRRTGGLPPGATVEYWWTVRDAGGAQAETLPALFQFNDERFAWRTLSEGQVSIHWYEGDGDFADEIMSAVQASLKRLEEDTGAHLLEPIDIFVYGSAADLRSALVFPQEWTGGVAFTRYSRIAIGIPPGSLRWGRRAITHELTHLVVHQMTLNPYSGLPTWLEEGLAMRSEGPLDLEFSASLESAIREGRLFSARSLSSPFSTSAQKSVLSYAESFSLVDFLVVNFGSEKMLELLQAFREGNTYDGALTEVYGFDTAGLDTRWRESLGSPATSAGGAMSGGVLIASGAG